MKKILPIFLLCFSSFMSFAYITQSNWRWKNNNGSESLATWRAGQNKPITLGSIDSVLRLRIQFNNTTGDVKNMNTNLQYASAPDGPWHYVTSLKGNNAFMLANTNNYVQDLTATTQQISGSANAFIAGKVLVRTTTLSVSMPNSTTSEHEYCIKPTNNISANTVYYFRVPNNDYPVALPSLATTATINSKRKSVTNGSFENNLQDWSFMVKPSSTATYTIVDSLQKDGIKALSVNVTKVGGATDVRLAHKALPLNIGATYMVRFWAKAKKRSAAMQLVVKGNRILTYDYKLYTGWQEFQFAFKAQSASVNLGFLFQTPTQYIIDHVEILDENNTGIDVPMNYMWQNKRAENEYAWLSADGVYSEPLPDGRTVWTCSDGWYGYNDTTTNSMSTHQLLRNTLIVQDAPRPDGNLVTNIGGTVSEPIAVMNPPDPQGWDDFFWPRDMTVENDSLKILLPDTRQQNQNDPVTYGNREAIGVFSLPDLMLRSIEYMPYIDTIQYGTLVKADDGYTYAYSKHEINPYEGRAIVARFPTGQLSVHTPWQFLTDTGWSYDYHNSKEIADVELYSVSRLGSNHYVSVFMTPASDKMEAEFAQSPIGPWVGRTIVGQIEGQDDIFTYFGVIHEETAKNGVYTLSYSNIGDIGQMLDDKTVYWPTFIKADLKSLSPFNDLPQPVQLQEFTASAAKEKVLLKWKTVTETNNDHFEIERSSDGKNNWATIASVKSKGNSLQRQNYNTYDVRPLNGHNYYRLKKVDKNNNVSFSNAQLVIFAIAKPILNVFPNPVQGGIIFLQLENYAGNKLNIQLSNMSGKVIFSKAITVQSNGLYKLPLTIKIAAGVYTLVVNGDELTETTKLVIQ
ncbi:T9SS type A sorting domain-containing protein [Panacibacter ginsenosidivorans]|uniref:T9SS type A sorting domain-containing protein n=1 Tax=Panacibacter ginsenosidivorans TaxID=1813871 RepID=A0A5B8V5V4_9BACT|nr:T9SS type A sorting domain-containing protein [Panacibacter ginsenosidivorans]QEC66602.1 T9SS type A sorting domain-containing protein [Panacibacter ginsenosidivorans]